MMRFIVQHHQRHSVIKITQNPPRESVRRFRPLVHHRVALPAFHVLGFGSKLVPVLNEHLPPLQARSHLDGNEIECFVIVVLAVWPQHL